MILTTHALTGAVIGKIMPETWQIVVCSLLSHYLLDTLRHGEYLNRNSRVKEVALKVFLDLSIGFVLIIVCALLAGAQNLISHMLLGSFFAMFPDLLTFLYWKGGLKFLRPLFLLHARTHRYPPFSPQRQWNLRNATNDIVISLVSIALFLFL